MDTPARVHCTLEHGNRCATLRRSVAIDAGLSYRYARCSLDGEFCVRRLLVQRRLVACAVSGRGWPHQTLLGDVAGQVSSVEFYLV